MISFAKKLLKRSQRLSSWRHPLPIDTKELREVPCSALLLGFMMLDRLVAHSLVLRLRSRFERGFYWQLG
jgi:hypothetical protein